MAQSPLLPDKLDDFVEGTLDKYYRKSWVDISLDRQFHIFAQQMRHASKKLKKVPTDGGTQLHWKVQLSNSGSYQHSEMFGRDVPGVGDHLTPATVQWSKASVSMSYDIDEEEFQSGPEKIIDLILLRNHAMLNDYWDGRETDMWTAPTSPTQNPRAPLGIPFWLQKSDTEAFGFNGANPSGFDSGAAGIDATENENWKNGTFAFDVISDDDALDKMADAVVMCNFKSPAKFPNLAEGVDFGFYSSHEHVKAYQKTAKAANDNIGADQGKYRVDAVFMSNPWMWVPALTKSSDPAYDSDLPIYGVNWATLYWCYKKNRDRFRHKPMVAPGQHTVRTVFMDSWGNWKCLDRRSNFVGKKKSAA